MISIEDPNVRIKGDPKRGILSSYTMLNAKIKSQPIHKRIFK